MSTVSLLPPRLLLICRLILLTTGFVSIYCLARMLQYKCHLHSICLSAVNVVYAYILIQLSFIVTSFPQDGTRIDDMPAALYMALIAADCILVIICLRLIAVHMKSKITPKSIKDAIDALPTGICCYDAQGRIHIINDAMQRLAGRHLGSVPANGESFWRDISALCDTDEAVGYILTDDLTGAVYQLRRREISIEGSALYEISASDITDLYRTNEALRNNNAEMHQANERLKSYGADMADVIRRRELLDAKVEMHDEIGQILLMMRYCLDKPGSIDTNAVAGMCVRLTDTLLNTDSVAEDTASDLYGNLIETARVIGIDVVIDGALPQAEPACTIIARAMHTSITNVRKHAQGTALYIKAKCHEDTAVVEFTNDGLSPAGEIYETGGLKSLRQLVECSDGRMVVCVEPRFMLRITLPVADADAQIPS